jgi:uridine kinase
LLPLPCSQHRLLIFSGVLMDSSADRPAIFEYILRQVHKRKKEKRPFVVGITGVDCSGKSSFTNAFEDFLRSRKIETQIIGIDDFHNPKAWRYSGKNQTDNYFNRSFDLSTVIDKLLVSIRAGKSFTIALPRLNPDTDEYDSAKKYRFSENTVVLFEGVFLFRKELSPYIDYKIFLDISFEECKRRAILRDSRATLLKYDEKYIPGQRYYMGLYPPDRTADLVIDNSDFSHPRIVTRARDEL